MQTCLPFATLAVLTFLGGCANNEQTDALIGGLGGAGIGALAGHALGHSPQTTLIGATIGGLGGVAIGGAIGRQLDEQDRRMFSQAYQQVLYAPVPYSTQPIYYASAPPPPPPSAPVPSYAQPQTVAPPAPSDPSSGALPVGPHRQLVSDHSRPTGTVATGSISVIEVDPPAQNQGKLCKTIRVISYVDGEEKSQDNKQCIDPNGPSQT